MLFMQGTWVWPLVRELDSTCHTKSLQAAKQKHNSSFNAQRSLPVCQWSWLGSAEGVLLRSCIHLQERTVSPDSNHTVRFNTMPDTRTEKERLENDLKAYFLVLCLVAQLHLTLCDPMDCSPSGSSVHGDPPGKNTGVGCHVLLQVIFPTQGLNPRLPHFRWILYRLSHQGSPRILELVLELVAYPFSRASSWRIEPGLLHCRWILYQLSSQGSPCWNHHSVSLPS